MSDSLNAGVSFLIRLTEVYFPDQIIPKELILNHSEDGYLNEKKKHYFENNANELIQVSMQINNIFFKILLD